MVELSETIMEINELRMGLLNSERISMNGKVGACCPVAAEVTRRIPHDHAFWFFVRSLLRPRRDRLLTSAATSWLELALTHSQFDFVLFVLFCARFFILFFSIVPLRRGQFFHLSLGVFSKHALITETILPQVGENEKPTGVFSYAFFA